MVNPVSRREFLNLLAATGGTAAALSAGSALNLSVSYTHLRAHET